MSSLNSKALLLVGVMLAACSSTKDNGVATYLVSQKRSEIWIQGMVSKYGQPEKYIRLDFGQEYITKVPLHIIWRNHGEIFPQRTVDVIRKWHKQSSEVIPPGTSFRLTRWEEYDGALYVRFDSATQDYPIDSETIAGYADTSIVGLKSNEKPISPAR